MRTFHKSGQRTALKRVVNQRTYTVHSPEVCRMDDRPIIIMLLLRNDIGLLESVFRARVVYFRNVK